MRTLQTVTPATKMAADEPRDRTSGRMTIAHSNTEAQTVTEGNQSTQWCRAVDAAVVFSYHDKMHDHRRFFRLVDAPFC